MAAKRKIMVPYPVLKEGLTELFERYEVYYPDRIVPRQEILDVLPQYDALISCGFLANAEAIEHMDNVKVMSTYGVGYGLQPARHRHGIHRRICYGPDVRPDAAHSGNGPQTAVNPRPALGAHCQSGPRP